MKMRYLAVEPTMATLRDLDFADAHRGVRRCWGHARCPLLTLSGRELLHRTYLLLPKADFAALSHLP